jgi:hypothetical protein
MIQTDADADVTRRSSQETLMRATFSRIVRQLDKGFDPS